MLNRYNNRRKSVQPRIKRWLDQQEISEEAISIFEESLICYNSKAWRSALLMSYVGFLTIVRDRILSASMPSGFLEPAWLQKGRDLRNPDKWDTNAFSCTQQKSPAPIFIVSDDLRHQVEFWKNRRNDCAHSKPNLITAGHVESFYSFLISNSSKFVVNGSRSSLLDRIKNHYDPDKTPLNTPVDELIISLNTSVESSELNEFIDEIFNYLDSTKSSYEILTGTISGNKIQFIEAIYRLGSQDVKSETLSKLSVSPELAVSVLRKNAQFSNELIGQPQLIRTIWRSHLFKHSMNDFGVLCSLINNRLIPDEQMNEVFEVVFEVDIQPNNLEQRTLELHDFNTFVRSKIVSGIFRNFSAANSAKKHIISFLNSIILDDVICNKIYDDFHNPWVADDLASALNNYFAENPHKVVEYRAHVQNCPSGLSGL